MNVSRQADAEFMRLLETEDPKRYDNLMRNIRKDSPDVRMTEEQALTNFHLGLPTGQHRFVIVAGKEYVPEKMQPSVEGRASSARKLRARIKQARAARSRTRSAQGIFIAS